LEFNQTNLLLVVVVDFSSPIENGQPNPNGVLYVFAFTNEHGDPVQLPNEASSNEAGTLNDYIPNIAYTSMNYVADISGKCYFENFNKEVALINQEIQLLLDEENIAADVNHFV
jgi:hypothetical protein